VTLSRMQAYQAMFKFLEAYYARGKADEIGILLGQLAIAADGKPMDPAAWNDWLKAVDQVAQRASKTDDK